MLQTLVRKSEGRTWLLIDSSAEALSRLADPDLSDDLCQIISDGSLAIDLRSNMIQVVRFGRLLGCLNTLLNLIDSPDESDRLKQYAVAAIRDMGDESSRSRLGQIARGWNQLSHGLCARICEALYPGVFDGQELMNVMGKVGLILPKGTDMTFSIQSHLESTLRPQDGAVMLDGLRRLQKTQGSSWALELMPTVLLALLRKNALTPEEIEISAKALGLIGHHNLDGTLHDEKLTDLDQATAKHPPIRKRYLWLSVEKRRQQNQDEPKMWFSFPAYYQILHPSNSDLAWLLNDIVQQKNPNNRIFALRLAIDIWSQSGRKWKDRLRIRKAVVHDANLLPLFRELLKGSRWLWIKRIWYRSVKQRLGRKWWWKHKLRKAKEQWGLLRDQWTLLWNIRALRSGKRIGWISSLCNESRDASNRDTLGVQSWETLKKKRGRWITIATKTGCKQFWKTFVPQLPHEKTDSSSIANGVIVGLSGIQAALDDEDLDFATITAADGELTARYAVNDLAGFPPWMPDLVKHRPESVQKVIHECICGEWRTPADHRTEFGVMSDLVYHDDGVIPLIQDQVLDLLRSGDPLNYSILSSALLILLGQDNSYTVEVSVIARHRIPGLDCNAQVFPLWMAVWLQLDAGLAIDRLEKVLPNTEEGGQIMVRICCLLGTERLNWAPNLSNPDYMIPPHCQRFIPLVYRYVKPSDDINRANRGAFTPENRDHAQMFRDGLLERLSRSEDHQSTKVLKVLLEVPETAHLRDWIMHHIELKVERDADLPPWIPGDLRIFMKEHEIDPKTDRDLFRITCKRLAEIKHDVEKSDNSLREEIHSDDDEMVLRRWLARKLNKRSRGRYTVPQEEEIDQQKRPDLRIENPHTAPISIEIKWADNWTIPQLLERLENQLIGQYLRSCNCCYGIYLLGMIGRKKHWQHPETNEMLSFEQVVTMVKIRTKELVGQSDHIQAIEVAIVDFRPPSF